MFAQSSLEFVENKGQWEKQVQFKGEIPMGSFFIQQKGFTVLMHNEDDMEAIMDPVHHNVKKQAKQPFDNGKAVDDRKNEPKIVRSHSYNVWFENANSKVQIVPEKTIPSVNNYFIGNDPSKWVSGARLFQSIIYKNMYDGIDVRYYSEGGKIKYDLIVNPGADPNVITLRYEGADKVSIKNNELIIKTSVGDVKELYPYSFEFSPATGRKDVDVKYVLTGNNTVKFKVRNRTPGSTLIIDPSLVFVSFTGSRADQYGFTATPGPDGTFYSGGIVFSEGFPTTPGAFQRTFQGGRDQAPNDIGIMKFSANGSQRLYATYLGGGSNDYPHSLFSDPQGNLVVMGRSYSPDFPGTQVGPGGGADIIVTKLNSTGSALIGSLKIGGEAEDGLNIVDMQMTGTASPNSLMQNYGDDSRSEVILDNANNIYVAAQTKSSRFPVTAGVFGAALGGKQDGVVMKINPTCTGVIWASYLGGNENDGAFVLSINPTNNDIYVAGATASSNFPGNKAGTISATFRGGTSDGFVAVVSNDGTTLRRSTFLGTPALDIIYGIQFDRLGFPYVMGITRGNWPVINAAYSNANSKQFVAKLRPDLSQYVYSTVFGSGASKPNMSPVAFLVDRCENVYISGWGGWINPRGNDPFDLAGVAGMPTTPDAFKPNTDNHDFYFIVLQKNASALLFGSFFGQNNGEGEHVDGGTSRFDQQGVIYQAICANCGGGNFPTTPGVIGPVNGALPNGCNLAAVKIAFNYAGVAAGPRPYFNNAVDSSGCAPFTVTLRDTVLNAKSYIWSFGDGTPDVTTTDFELQHTFQNVGNYRVRLIAIDSNTCNIRDTAYINIRVRADKADIDFTATKQPPCESLTYRFQNTSIAPAGKPFQANSFTWDFGDGTPRITTGTNTLDHTFPAAGTYNVRLILTDTNYCNAPDSMTLVLRVAPLVEARFEVPGPACAPFTAAFVNTSLAGQTFTWDFGDGSTSTETNPVHIYNKPGTYTVTLTAVDPSTCNVTNTIRKTITVTLRPTADFSWAPQPPEVNKPTVFTNLSSGAVRYVWYFGDGDSTLKNTRDTVLHQYQATGTYQACLVSFNEEGCADTTCIAVDAIIEPLLDVPNAFTPGRFGRNSIIKVEGFGIAKMTWRIYNRWGQKVFESNSIRQGWDGTFKGELQPMDVYAYTLDVEFFDGNKLRKTGDITLIR